MIWCLSSLPIHEHTAVQHTQTLKAQTHTGMCVRTHTHTHNLRHNCTYRHTDTASHRCAYRFTDPCTYMYRYTHVPTQVADTEGCEDTHKMLHRVAQTCGHTPEDRQANMHMCTQVLNYGIKLLILIHRLSSPSHVFQNIENNLTDTHPPTARTYKY